MSDLPLTPILLERSGQHPTDTVSSLGSQAELLPLVQCPVCSEVPRAKVFQCKEGHHLCETCYKKLQGQPCPVCRAVMPKDPCRSRLAEDLVDKAKYRFPCVYVTDGCKEKGTKSGLERHEKYCNFRAIECPIEKGCQMSRTDVVNHIKKEHRNTVLAGNTLKLDMSMLVPTEWEQIYLLEEVTFKPSFWYVPPPLIRLVLSPLHLTFLVQADISNSIYNGLACEIRVDGPSFGHMMFRCQIFDLEDSVESMMMRQVAGSVVRGNLKNLMKGANGNQGGLKVSFDLVAQEEEKKENLIWPVMRCLQRFFASIQLGPS